MTILPGCYKICIWVKKERIKSLFFQAQLWKTGRKTARKKEKRERKERNKKYFRPAGRHWSAGRHWYYIKSMPPGSAFSLSSLENAGRHWQYIKSMPLGKIVTFMSRGEGVIGKWGPPKGLYVFSALGRIQENAFIMPEGETHFAMKPGARLMNDNFNGLLQNMYMSKERTT